ncbi:MAG: nucleotidyltransferase family protein [Actinomycetota bacterium]
MAARLKVEAAAVAVTRAFERAGIAAIVLKGVTFAHWLYDSPETRPHGDLDLLIPPGRLVDAETVLEEMGYSYVPIDRPADSGLLAPPRDAIAGDITGASRDWSAPGLVPVDLHLTLPGIEASDEIAWQILSAHREPLDVATGTVTSLDGSARALHVALHAQQHQDDLEHAVIDLRLAIEATPIAVWKQALGLARQLDAEPSFAAGLCSVAPGAAIAERIGASLTPSMRTTLHEMRAPNETLFVERFLRTPGLRRRAVLGARKLFPPAPYMRASVPYARRGSVFLVAAYATRFIRFVARAPRGVILWARAARKRRAAR